MYVYIYIYMYRYMYMYAYAGFCYRVSLNGQGSRLQPWMLWPSTPRNDFSHSLRHSPASLCPWLAMWELFPSGSCTCLGFRAVGLGFTPWASAEPFSSPKVPKEVAIHKDCLGAATVLPRFSFFIGSINQLLGFHENESSECNIPK